MADYSSFKPSVDGEYVTKIDNLIDELQTDVSALEGVQLGEQFIGSSTTSNTIGTGSKTFTVESDRAWTDGTSLKITDTANEANYMQGNVTSYSGTTVIVNVTTTGGSGTKTSWSLGLVGGNFIDATVDNRSYSRRDGAWQARTPTTVSVDTTLTSTSSNYYIIDTAHVIITLPDATTLGTEALRYTFTNTSSGMIKIEDSANGFICGIPSGKTQILNLNSTSTAAGSWSLVINENPNHYIGPETVFEATNIQSESVVKVDTDKFLIAYKDNGDNYATYGIASVNDNDVTIGTLAKSSSETITGWVDVCILSTSAAIAVYENASGYVKAVYLGISGTTITPETPVTVEGTGTNTDIKVCALSSTTAIVIYDDDSTTAQGVVLSVSGTTITPGGGYTAHSADITDICISPIDSTHAFFSYSVVSGADLRTKVITESSGTLAFSGIGSNAGVCNEGSSCVALSTTHAITVQSYYDATSQQKYARLSLWEFSGGGTPSIRTNKDFMLGNYVLNPWLEKISATEAILMYRDPNAVSVSTHIHLMRITIDTTNNEIILKDAGTGVYENMLLSTVVTSQTNQSRSIAHDANGKCLVVFEETPDGGTPDGIAVSLEVE